jgi:hypothetical protein
MPASKDYAWAEDRYPTQEEFDNHGGGPSATATHPQSWFQGDVWNARSEVNFTWVNNASAKLKASLIDSQGNVVNESEGQFERSMYRPFNSGPHTLNVSTSSVHHQCGVTGKSKISIAASLYVVNYSENWNPTRLWGVGYSYNGSDVSRPACQEKEEEEEVYRGGESGEGCGDAEYCSGGGPYPSYPTYSGNGGASPSAMCTLWRFIGYESADGGATWEEVYRYYVWVC